LILYKFGESSAYKTDSSTTILEAKYIGVADSNIHSFTEDIM